MELSIHIWMEDTTDYQNMLEMNDYRTITMVIIDICAWI